MWLCSRAKERNERGKTEKQGPTNSKYYTPDIKILSIVNNTIDRPPLSASDNISVRRNDHIMVKRRPGLRVMFNGGSEQKLGLCPLGDALTLPEDL